MTLKRNEIATTDLGPFRQWLEDSGWEIGPDDSPARALLARMTDRKWPLMVFERDGVYYVSGRDVAVVRAFKRRHQRQ